MHHWLAQYFLIIDIYISTSIFQGAGYISLLLCCVQDTKILPLTTVVYVVLYTNWM